MTQERVPKIKLSREQEELCIAKISKLYEYSQDCHMYDVRDRTMIYQIQEAIELDINYSIHGMKQMVEKALGLPIGTLKTQHYVGSKVSSRKGYYPHIKRIITEPIEETKTEIKSLRGALQRYTPNKAR